MAKKMLVLGAPTVSSGKAQEIDHGMRVIIATAVFSRSIAKEDLFS